MICQTTNVAATGGLNWALDRGSRAECLPPSRANAKVHLVGAAGAGMRALADVLHGRGCRLSGSDAASPAAMPEPWIRPGHAADHLPADCDLVVYSPAVAEDNPELALARRYGIPTVSYPQMLGRLMDERRGLAVAGTHGKSTTTAMAAAILHAADLDPTVLFGAMPVLFGATPVLSDPMPLPLSASPYTASSGGRHGSGQWLLAEACEYRNHFQCLHPEIAVLLGIQWDHVDCFPTLASVEAAFDGFVAGVAADGLLLVAGGCPAARRVADRSGRRYETFGFGPDIMWQPSRLRERAGRCSFTIVHHNRAVCNVALRVPGRHNVLNAVAAAALAWHAGADAPAVEAGLNGFCGLRRRLEHIGQSRGVAVIDDYAHHPTAVAASLSAVRAWFGKRRIWCVFQPHQAARTRALLDEFAGSMHNADRVVVAEVFLAREPAGAAASVRAAELARLIEARGGNVAAVHETDEIKKLLRSALRPGDVLVTMGAGDIGKVAHDFVQRL